MLAVNQCRNCQQNIPEEWKKRCDVCRHLVLKDRLLRRLTMIRNKLAKDYGQCKVCRCYLLASDPINSLICLPCGKMEEILEKNIEEEFDSASDPE